MSALGTVAPAAPVTGWGLLQKALRTMWWVWLFPVSLVAALVTRSVFFLNYVHVLSAILWTGADLLMGFVIGPTMRRLDIPARMKVQNELLPRTLLFFPIMAGTTTTAGWYLAKAIGFWRPDSPMYWWLMAALAVVTFLGVQGLGVLLPTNLRVYFEMQKPQPDGARIGRMMGKYFMITGFQGTMQICIVFIMAHLVMG